MQSGCYFPVYCHLFYSHLGIDYVNLYITYVFIIQAMLLAEEWKLILMKTKVRLLHNIAAYMHG